MSICPFAKLELLPENFTQGHITPTTIVGHTNGSAAHDLRGYFGQDKVVVESHFQIDNDPDATLYQYIDTNVRADANLAANTFAISVEVADGGDCNTPMTPAQVARFIQLCRWAHEEHGIELRQCTSPAGGGIGWHSMWGFKDPINLTGPVANPWSPARGKICPGKVRIGQIINDIIPNLGGGDMLDSPTLSNQSFVDDCYARILGRQADPTGRAFWTGKLDRNEMTRNDLRFEFQIVRDAARDAMIGGGSANSAGVQAAVAAATAKFYADLAAFAAKAGQS